MTEDELNKVLDELRVFEGKTLEEKRELMRQAESLLGGLREVFGDGVEIVEVSELEVVEEEGFGGIKKEKADGEG